MYEIGTLCQSFAGRWGSSLRGSRPRDLREGRSRAHFVTKARGGEGAVREVIELLLKTQKKYDTILKRFQQ